jgi:hypothetical protein
LLERTVNLKIEEAYPKLKAALVEKGFKLISEEPPEQICFKQGSLWGISPKTAKKTLIVNLENCGEKTGIGLSSRLASDWKNITLIGCCLAFVLAGLCVWMATDLTMLITTNVSGFWSWLVTVNDKVNLAATQTFVNLTWGLTVFLSLVIMVEVAIVVYTHSKIDSFNEKILNEFH